MNSRGERRAIAYCRISSRAQTEGTSLDTQADETVKHAEAMGFTVVDVVREVFSGANLWDRQALTALRQRVKSGEFDGGALVCLSTDRLSRSATHLAILVEELDRHSALPRSTSWDWCRPCGNRRPNTARTGCRCR